MLVKEGTDTPIASSTNLGLTVQAHMADRGGLLAEGTVVFPNSDNTERNGPTIPLPSFPQGLGSRLCVWVRNPTDQPLILRVRHAVIDQVGPTTRWGVLSDLGGPATAQVERTTIANDGMWFFFEGGLMPLGSICTLQPVAPLGGAGGATVSISCWIRG